MAEEKNKSLEELIKNSSLEEKLKESSITLLKEHKLFTSQQWKEFPENQKELLPKYFVVLLDSLTKEVERIIKSEKSSCVYSFGSNKYGELCFGDTNDRNKPELVKSLKDKEIIQVCAGWSFTILLSSIINHI